MLDRAQTLVTEVNKTSSKNDKVEALRRLIRDDREMQALLHRVYHPRTRFNITSKSVRKWIQRTDERATKAPVSIIDLLDLLGSDTGPRGNDALRLVSAFIDNNKQYTELIYTILDKNLEMRADVKSINKAIPFLIPEFNVALAESFDKYVSKIDWENDSYFAMRKLDGVRCIAIKESDQVMFYSRNAKEFDTLGRLKEALLTVPGDFVLDGELCLVDENGDEDFQSVMKEIRRKDHTIAAPLFKVFDCLTVREFEISSSAATYSERMSRDLIQDLQKLPVVDVVPMHRVKSAEEVSELMTEATSLGWEGLILRKDAPYKGKRTSDLLKVKKFHDAEFNVIDLAYEEHRSLINGVDTKEEVLAQIYIDYKGNRVGVGSGFTKEQRRYYKEHPEELIGAVVTIQFFEETTNKDGTKSLRFPTLKFIHGRSREV